MNYRFLQFGCPCGNIANAVSVGTTSGGHLMTKWTCGKCGKDVVALVSIESLIEGLPSPPSAVSDTDKVFLKGGHILWEGGK